LLKEESNHLTKRKILVNTRRKIKRIRREIKKINKNKQITKIKTRRRKITRIK
jgi:hypothetical protein